MATIKDIDWMKIRFGNLIEITKIEPASADLFTSSISESEQGNVYFPTHDYVAEAKTETEPHTPMCVDEVVGLMNHLTRKDSRYNKFIFQNLDFEAYADPAALEDIAQAFGDPSKIRDFCIAVEESENQNYAIHGINLNKYISLVKIAEEAGLEGRLLEIVKLAAIREELRGEIIIGTHGLKNEWSNSGFRRASELAREYGVLTPSGEEWVYELEERVKGEAARATEESIAQSREFSDYFIRIDQKFARDKPTNPHFTEEEEVIGEYLPRINALMQFNDYEDFRERIGKYKEQINEKIIASPTNSDVVENMKNELSMIEQALALDPEKVSYLLDF
jgi:hypothetical protein